MLQHILNLTSAQRSRFWIVAGLAFCCLLVAAIAPAVLSLYWLRIVTSIWMFAAFAQSINVMVGFLGYAAFGNVVFFGLGGYATAVAIVRLNWTYEAGLAAGMLACLVLVLVVGPPILRLRGHYFAIATLGLNETIKAIVSNLTSLTGGGMGISLPFPSETVEVSARYFYWMFLGLAVSATLVALFLRTTRFGYACRAILANEEGAGSMGINTTFYKTAAWVISAVIAGLAGGIYALWIGYIDTPSVFDMTIAVKGFVMILIGGAGTVIGPILGAFMVELAVNLTWSHLLKYHLAILGIIIMVAAVVKSKGLPPQFLDRISRAKADRAVRP